MHGHGLIFPGLMEARLGNGIEIKVIPPRVYTGNNIVIISSTTGEGGISQIIVA